MPSIQDSRGQRPFPAIDKNSEEGNWTQIDENHAEEQFELLPPLQWRGGWSNGSSFFVGEPHSHDADGMPIHTLVVRANGGIYARHARLDLQQQMVVEILGMTMRNPS